MTISKKTPTQSTPIQTIPALSETNYPEINYPDSIKVSGFPIFFQGWNGIYRKSDTKSDRPIYTLDSYFLYYLIKIIGVNIFYDEERKSWVMQRHGDSFNFAYNKSETPFGNWGRLIKVEPYKKEVKQECKVDNHFIKYSVPAFCVGILSSYLVSKVYNP